MLRERAAARKAVVTHEAEADEATIQIASLNEIYQEVRENLEEVERNFAGGRVFAPIAESSQQVSRIVANRWGQARRSLKSWIKAMSSSIGTSPTSAY